MGALQRWKDRQEHPEDWTVPGISQSNHGRTYVEVAGPEKVRTGARKRAWTEVPRDLSVPQQFLWVEAYVEGFIAAAVSLGMTS